MPVVAMPDGTRVAFPDNMPAEQIKGMIAQKFPDAVKGSQPAPQEEGSMLPAAIRDVPKEIGAAFTENLDAAKKGLLPSGQGERGVVENLLNTGKGVAAIPGMVLSPLTGAARSLIGHPLAAVEDAGREFSGMPADPEGSYKRAKGDVDLALAAARAGGPRPAAAPRPLTEGQEVIAAADRLSQTGAPVQVPRAVTTDSTALQRTAATARNIPLAGDPLVRASEKTLGQLGTKADEVASGFGGGTVQGAGDTARGAIKDWITGESATKAKKLYDRVDNLVNPQSTMQLINARGVAAEIEAERMAARLPNGKAVDTILEAVNDGNGLTYQGIKTLRSKIGEAMNSGILPEGMSGSDLKRIYSALTDDLRSSIRVGGGQQAVAEFDRANRYYKLISDRRESLAKIIGTDGNAPAERVFDRLTAMASSSSRGDVAKLAQARKAIGADDWNEFASGVVAKLGRNAEGDFSPALFVRDYGKISEAGKSMLFKSGGKGDLAQHLDDIARISSRHKELQKFANPSGTGQALLGGGIGAGFLADPLTTATLVLGGRTVAYALSRPASAASLAKYARAQQALSTGPTPAKVAAFSLASRNLIATLGERAQGVSVEQFLRGLQNAMPIRAEDEENNP